MRTILIPSAGDSAVYRQIDPDWDNEAAFEKVTAEALAQAYPSYRCVVFDGGFSFRGQIYRPDLALIARDLSHWFVVEVELVSHSLEKHVIPQVRAFSFGNPVEDCAPKLAKLLGIADTQARTFVEYVPRAATTVVNRWDEEWRAALAAVEVQMSEVTRLISPAGDVALAIDGSFEIVRRHLGFGIYSAGDRSVRFPRGTSLALGTVQLIDPSGAVGLWSVRASDDGLWATKDIGAPPIPDGCYVQLMLTEAGEFHLRLGA